MGKLFIYWLIGAVIIFIIIISIIIIIYFLIKKRKTRERFSGIFLRKNDSNLELFVTRSDTPINSGSNSPSSKKKHWWHYFNRTHPIGKLDFDRYQIITPPTRIYTTYFCSLLIINKEEKTSLKITIQTLLSKSDLSQNPCAITFCPNEVVIRPGERSEIGIEILPTRIGPINLLISFTPYILPDNCATPPYFIPLRIEGLPIVDNVIQFKWKDVQASEPEKIGLGASAIIYRVKYGDKIMAVKKFLVSSINALEVEEFSKEAIFLSRLQHPFIVKLYGICSEPENLAVLMEYLHLGSLRDLLRGKVTEVNDIKNELAWNLRLKFALDGARALAFLHKARFLHRDIKSDNFLVASININDDVHLKLADFGISKELQQDTSQVFPIVSSPCPGTPQWMAPEILNGDVSSKASDIWSFGVVLWELATFKKPHSEFKWAHEIQKFVTSGGRLKISQEMIGMPVEYTSIIDKCCCLKPEDRIVVDDLLSLLYHIQPRKEWTAYRGSRPDNISITSMGQKSVINHKDIIIQTEKELDMSIIIQEGEFEDFSNQ